jgi:plasmid maintenance system antidote protein VapI
MSGINKEIFIKIIKDEIKIDLDTAKKLSDTLGYTPEMWINLGDQKYKK